MKKKLLMTSAAALLIGVKSAQVGVFAEEEGASTESTVTVAETVESEVPKTTESEVSETTVDTTTESEPTLTTEVETTTREAKNEKTTTETTTEFTNLADVYDVAPDEDVEKVDVTFYVKGYTLEQSTQYRPSSFPVEYVVVGVLDETGVVATQKSKKDGSVTFKVPTDRKFNYAVLSGQPGIILGWNSVAHNQEPFSVSENYGHREFLSVYTYNDEELQDLAPNKEVKKTYFNIMLYDEATETYPDKSGVIVEVLNSAGEVIAEQKTNRGGGIWFNVPVEEEFTYRIKEGQEGITVVDRSSVTFTFSADLTDSVTSSYVPDTFYPHEFFIIHFMDETAQNTSSTNTSNTGSATTPNTSVNTTLATSLVENTTLTQSVEAEEVKSTEPTKQTQTDEITSTSVASTSYSTEAKTTVASKQLPNTGEAANYAVFSAAALSVLAGVGLVASKRYRDNA